MTTLLRNTCAYKVARNASAALAASFKRGFRRTSGLLDGTDFVACDMPTANRLTIHILAAVAEHKREMISKRAKRHSRKRSGEAPSYETRPCTKQPREQPPRIASAGLAPELKKLMSDWRPQGKTLRAIAHDLNRLNIRPAGGRQ